MQTLLTIAIIIVCVLLILVVLVQNSKGGGISSNFSAANQIMGARRGTDFIEKATWSLAGAIMVISIILTIKLTPKEVKVEAPAQTEQPAGAPQGEQPAK